MSPRTDSRRRAFTILELMVATAITSILIVVLVTLGVASLDAWGNSRSFARYQSSARAALDLLDSDLRSMISRGRLPGEGAGAPWLEAKYEPSAGTTSAALTFFSQATDMAPDWDGDFSAIRYQLVDQDPARPDDSGPTGMLALYRAVAAPEATTEKALGATDIDAEFWLGEDVGNPENLLAQNVVILSVEFWVKGTDGVRRRADWGRGNWLRIDRRMRVTWDGLDTGVEPFRLSGIDLAVEVVSDRGMNLIQGGATLSEVPPSERRVFSQFVPAIPER